MSKIYTLYACDAWAGKDSMRPLGVTTNETMLCSMIGARIKAGDMEYDGQTEIAPAWNSYLEDCKKNTVDLDKLKYGFVDTREDMQITDGNSYNEHPEIADAYMEITGLQAKAAVDALDLNSHSFIYSEVEVRTDFGYISFNMPGFCDRDKLENSDEFQEFMEGTTDCEINTSVYTYSVGCGKSESATAEELVATEKYKDELDREYGVDYIQSDFISFYYEAEQEY